MAHPQTLSGLQSGAYTGTKILKLTSSNLSSFPREILTLFSTLEILDLSGNPISALPKDISRLHKLRILFLSNCQFKTWPKELSQCRSLEMVAFKGNGMTTIPEHSFPRKLRWLILTNNEIEKLPETIGDCQRLEKCMLAGNRLRGLPEGMRRCRKLGLLRLSANCIERVPEWVWELPELGFLSFAGNFLGEVGRGVDGDGEVNVDVEEKGEMQEISWHELQVGKVLGEGASGIISQGQWTRLHDGQEKGKDVAIKLFKGEVTSDGSPLDELNATLLAGQHPNLINPLGKIHGHPNATKGLVMELIPPHFKNLGGPPSFDTCTRDTFPMDRTLSLQQVLGILTGIAKAASHLHERGIAHGDLYAHNVLVDAEGRALLGDFGAATVYHLDEQVGGRLERLEILAFAHLVEDLLGLVVRDVVVVGGGEGEETIWNEKEGGLVEGLNRLHWRCSDPVLGARPGFAEVVEMLDEL